MPTVRIGLVFALPDAPTDSQSLVLRARTPAYKRDTITKDNPFSTQGATLEYEVKLDPNFECKKGGKLPGLAGGRGNGRGCGGGADPSDCFSVRMMWRRQCNGELYIYAARDKQKKGFCTKYRDCTNASQ